MDRKGKDKYVSSRYTLAADFDKPGGGRDEKDIVYETATIGGNTRTIKRLYQRYDNGFNGVGWIVDDDIDNCMVCNSEFGFFLRKHHCRSCGNIVCYSCSPDEAVIEEMADMGEQRVCVQCYWGQHPVYASHTRTWQEEEDSSDEEEYLVASRINAAINASVRTFRVQLHRYFEYDNEVVLEQDCDWASLCACVVRDMGLLDDLSAKRGTDNVYRMDHPPIDFRYFVLVDADGDEMSPKLDSSRLFWQFASRYSVIEKTLLMAYPAKGQREILEEAREGRRSRLAIESRVAAVTVQSTVHASSAVIAAPSTITTTTIGGDGSGDASERVSSESMTSSGISQFPSATVISRRRQDSDDSDMHDNFRDEDCGKSTVIIPTRILRASHVDSDDSEEEEGGIEVIDKAVGQGTSLKDRGDTAVNVRGGRDIHVHSAAVTPLPDHGEHSYPDSFDVMPVNTDDKVATVDDDSTPTKVELSSLDEHRRTVHALLETGDEGRGGRTTRSASVIYPHHHNSLMSSPTGPGGNVGGVNAFAHLLRSTRPRRKSTGGPVAPTLSREDAALLTLARRSLRHSVTEQDRFLLRKALGADNMPVSRNSSTEMGEDEVSAALSVVAEMAQQQIGDGEGPAVSYAEVTRSDDDSISGRGEASGSRPSQKKYALSKEDEELLFLARHSLSEAPVYLSATVGDVGSTPYTASSEESLSVRAGAGEAGGVASTITPFGGARRASYNGTTGAQPAVSPEEALRLLMTLETKKSPSSSTIGMGGMTAASTQKKLSSADEALLQLARMSISRTVTASDNEELTTYIARASAMFGPEDTERLEEAGGSENDNADEDYMLGRPSAMSLKDIHRAALFEAFVTVSRHAINNAGEVEEMSEDEAAAERDNDETHRLLAQETFLKWEQIQNVLGEGILTDELIVHEFASTVQTREEAVKSRLSHTTTAGDSQTELEAREDVAVGGGYIDFEGFCSLMERLEILAEEVASAVDHDQDPTAHIPGDIKEAYVSLCDSGVNDGSGMDRDEGVSLASVLQWSQLRGAIEADLLNEEVVERLFAAMVSRNRPAGTSASTSTLNDSSEYDGGHENQGGQDGVDALICLQQFNDLSQLLQREIDKAAGEAEALTVGDSNRGIGGDGTAPNGGAFSPLGYDDHKRTMRRGSESNKDNDTYAAATACASSCSAGPASKHVSFMQSDVERLGGEGHTEGSGSGGPVVRKSRNASLASVDSVDTYFVGSESGIIESFDGDDDNILNVVMTGMLYKQGSKVRSWKYRNFVLKGCRLSYYDTTKLKGEFSTKDCVVCELDPSEAGGKEHAFVISGPGRFLNLYADDEDSRDRWIYGIMARIEAYASLTREQVIGKARSSGGSGNVAVETQGDERDDEGVWEGEDRALSSDASSLSVVPAVMSGGSSNASGSCSVWDSFLDPNETLLCCGEVVKRNKYGMAQRRQLLLAQNMTPDAVSMDGLLPIPRLFYVDAAVMKVKGEVEWKPSSPPFAELVNPSTFKIMVDSRTFRLTVPVDKASADQQVKRSAEEWVTHINEAVRTCTAPSGKK